MLVTAAPARTVVRPNFSQPWRLLLVVDATSALRLSSFYIPYFDASPVYNHNCTIIQTLPLLNCCTATAALHFFRLFTRICKQLHPLLSTASRRVAPAFTSYTSSPYHTHHTFFIHTIRINDWQVALRHVRIQDRPDGRDFYTPGRPCEIHWPYPRCRGRLVGHRAPGT